MPYRAIIWTMVTVGLALLAVGMWIGAVEPMVATAQTASTLPGVYPTTHAANVTTPPPAPPVEQRVLVKGMLFVSFILICLLLVVGFFATLREWMRYSGGTERKGKKTRYVDAWKIAGERLKEKGTEKGPDDPPSSA